jgi:ubiquinone/menaquinone biosynthesis C-methylase UbiE
MVRVKSYLGVDYARTMVERCKQDLPSYSFVVGDACRLDFAADGSYDLVLFSYNGIDHLDLADRERALFEMKRVLRPGGTMVFSSHNSNFLPEIVDRFRWAHAARDGAIAEMGAGLQSAQSDAALPPAARHRHRQRRASFVQVIGHLLHQARPAGAGARSPRHGRHKVCAE